MSWESWNAVMSAKPFAKPTLHNIDMYCNVESG